ncbi:flagellar biosynthetic protein FliO [Methylomonas sp. LL1]|uniref:flagellar biosynthetic protein FliO n=1 Tax=Methylomonas sp. LL1 TaxID=2785785 RepID=UPI0018C3D302|nr:flagellar biosynthetic protein FliO [Methylomonas sp. LL1]QPK62134.1 flagellar biosynthetic protein FliO [Methylomonas sp. LL1]
MNKKCSIVFGLGLLNTFAAHAEEVDAQRQAAKIVSYADVLQWVLALGLVLAIFGLLIWLLRKTGGLSFAGKSQLAVISGLSLGMREKLVLVRVGEKQLLLGVTPGRVDKLLELEGESRLFQEQPGDNDSGLFAKKLQQVLQGKADV